MTGVRGRRCRPDPASAGKSGFPHAVDREMTPRLLCLLGLATLALAGCGSAGVAAPAVRSVALPAGMLVPQVLSLSTDPADGALFLVTDQGLLRVAREAQSATRVDGTYGGVALRPENPVAFVGPGRLLGSGHPAKSSPGVPENLGLLISGDTGATWQSVGLLDKADLHLLRPAGRRLWAYDVLSQTLALTRDNGATWIRPPAPGLVTDLAVDPADDRHLIAVTEHGVVESRNEGRGWRPSAASNAQYVLWASHGLVLTTDASGEVRRSTDGGSGFRVVGRLEAPPQAPLMAADGALFAALAGGRIQRSTDQGENWKTVLRLVGR